MSIALIDPAWIGTFVDSDYVVPIDELKAEASISTTLKPPMRRLRDRWP